MCVKAGHEGRHWAPVAAGPTTWHFFTCGHAFSLSSISAISFRFHLSASATGSSPKACAAASRPMATLPFALESLATLLSTAQAKCWENSMNLLCWLAASGSLLIEVVDCP